jgi:hypothetical protein
MEKPKRARRRKPDTAKVDLEPPLVVPGGQGVHREVESEGHAEKYRAVIEGATPKMNWSAKRWGKVEPAYMRRRRYSSAHRKQGVCGRHGMEEQHVTSGGLVGSPAGTGVNRPISESEVASDALPVDGRLCST